MAAFPGQEMPVGPRATIGTSTFLLLRLVVPGPHGSRYVLSIDLRGLRPVAKAGERAGRLQRRARLSHSSRQTLASENDVITGYSGLPEMSDIYCTSWVTP